MHLLASDNYFTENDLIACEGLNSFSQDNLAQRKWTSAALDHTLQLHLPISEVFQLPFEHEFQYSCL